MKLEFFVPGVPRPQGSKRHLGNGVMVESSKYVGEWRALVGYVAAQSMRGRQIVTGGVEVAAVFVFPRPQKHYHRVKGILQLKPDAQFIYPIRPDLDKLIRAVLDALSGIVYADDCQVISCQAGKFYGAPTGVNIAVAFDDPIPAAV